MSTIRNINLCALPEKWQPYAKIALAQTPESLAGIHPETLHGAILALLSDLADVAEGRDHYLRMTREQNDLLVKQAEVIQEQVAFVMTLREGVESLQALILKREESRS